MAIRYITDGLGEVISSIERTSVFGFDYETTGLSPLDSRILLCQIGTPDEQYVINVASCPIEPLIPYLASNRWKKIIHNAKFEQRFTQIFFKTTIQNVWDTYLAELVLNPDSKQNGLAAVLKRYLGVELNKETRSSFFEKKKNVFTERQIEYSAQDVEHLIPLMELQEAKAELLNLRPTMEMEFTLAGVVAAMENTGIPVDVASWRSKVKQFEELHEESRLRMHELLFDSGKMDEQIGLFTRDSINMNSPKQVKNALLKMGIDVDSTNEREIALLKHPVAKELLKYREYQKILSSYGSSFIDKIHPFTQRLHPDFQQLGTETGRFSCREPNVQQIPEAFHECITLAGYRIVTADYSQIELRILAHLSGDPNLVRAFESGEDLHKSTASMMFKIPIESITKEQRFQAKIFNFGISYGMGVTKLRDTLNAEALKSGTAELKFPQVQALLNRYHATYRVAAEWLAETGALAYRQGYIQTVLGRKRFFTRPDINTLPQKDFENQVSAIRRKGSNTVIQGTNADLTKMAMINVYNELNEAGFRANLISQVHDELVVLAQQNQAEEVKVVLEETMRRTAEQVITRVPIKCDAVVSLEWRK